MHCRRDRLHYAVDVAEHVVVPEAQHPIAARFKVRRSSGVASQAGRFGVLPAVYLDDQARSVTGKVREVGTDGRLSAKMGAVDR